MATKTASTKKAPAQSSDTPKKALIIVESPSKAKTIKKYLGRGYTVKASVGHIKDLPRSTLGVDVAKSFKPDYQVIKGKDKVVQELKDAAKDASEIYLAPDPDREGEAIAWHISEELPKKGKKVYRVLFNSVTKPAILEALKHPLELDKDKYNAQQARRILDRLVGYKISPVLWDKVKRGLSAGRVQSVAVRLVVDREAEIKKFKPEEYWTLEALFNKNGQDFKVRLVKIDGSDPELPNQETTDRLLHSLEGQPFDVIQITTKERQRKPQAPFITSKLQQEAARKLGFSAKKTMTLAQKLYEGKDLGEEGTHGLITYMRTDSVRITPEVMPELRALIESTYGKEYLPAEPIIYKTKKSAQDAHEAIRPANLAFNPEKVQPFLDYDEFRLYQLIWNRFIACQMAPAIYDQTSMDLLCLSKDSKKALFRVSGSIVKFAGYTKVYEEGTDETNQNPKKASDGEEADEDNSSNQKLPQLVEGERMHPKEFLPEQHFTAPPPRFSDASLIKELEEKGIGRPSTYATILSNIQDREYVEKRQNKFYPTELGIVVTDLLVRSFPEILDAQFTAGMEEKLDEVEEGRTDWVEMMRSFWKPFEKTLEAAKANMKNIKQLEIPTEHNCVKCNATMMVKWGKLGQFLACSNYPDCKYTSEFMKDDSGKIILLAREKSGKKCKKCDAEMLIKNGKFGKFLACENYPDCKSTEAIGTGIACPVCIEGELAQRVSRFKRIFYGCNRYPACTNAMWDKPVVGPCPTCNAALLMEKTTKKDGTYIRCTNKECDYRREAPQPVDPAASAAPSGLPVAGGSSAA